MHGHKKTSHLPIRYFLALLWAHPILHISTIRVNNACTVAGIYSAFTELLIGIMCWRRVQIDNRLMKQFMANPAIHC